MDDLKLLSNLTLRFLYFNKGKRIIRKSYQNYKISFNLFYFHSFRDLLSLQLEKILHNNPKKDMEKKLFLK